MKLFITTINIVSENNFLITSLIRAIILCISLFNILNAANVYCAAPHSQDGDGSLAREARFRASCSLLSLQLADDAPSDPTALLEYWDHAQHMILFRWEQILKKCKAWEVIVQQIQDRGSSKELIASYVESGRLECHIGRRCQELQALDPLLTHKLQQCSLDLATSYITLKFKVVNEINQITRRILTRYLPQVDHSATVGVANNFQGEWPKDNILLRLNSSLEVIDQSHAALHRLMEDE